MEVYKPEGWGMGYGLAHAWSDWADERIIDPWLPAYKQGRRRRRRHKGRMHYVGGRMRIRVFR